ncbi:MULTISPECIES: aldose 1-epimerase family protein [Antarcticibacterium]|uniref:aldose 1-epimerase family protein n=1 Tax=Antarcticibacterium TaxID=2058174 RepID=UPI002938F0C8|nr:aldose 1-epimerase family protein [Antarcticibacterium flavum]
MHRIQNEFLSIAVKDAGAELCSLKNLETDTEHIWQADPEVWSSHAPNLFPVIGVLKDGEYIYEGEKFPMPKHGIVRHNENLQLQESTENSLLFALTYSEETLKQYPFKFRFSIEFILEEKTLKVSHSVHNLDEKPMYFSLGGHPAFNAPLYEGEEYEDYFLEFDKKMDLKSYVLNEEGLISNSTKSILQNDNVINLHKHLFDEDALIFQNIASRSVALKSKKSGLVLTVDYRDFKDLGIWAKPGAPYVCIEPWLGMADVEGTDQQLKFFRRHYRNNAL